MRRSWKQANRRELNWWENSYLPSVISGIFLTSKHFFYNVTFHILHLFGIAKKTKGAVTYQYPENPRPLASRLRTRHRLMKREDGSPRCVACMMCETVCPARCIEITAAGHPDPHIEKYPAEFILDLGKCVYCGFCVEVCPEDAIRMDTRRLDTAEYSRGSMVYDKKRLME
ncbi:MAG: NADH-quinone oxidoreductase subunit I [Candidatus Omnitrophica bacterium]|nr:NADH-quinone oxidoreductase subunit I [Candidatus Omnitrophota bacterium]MDE2009585.1 NADH-quinone oxidoreductase subunit I [Candidatus Omnitrophota bacterium]MDE2214629.1 NADH-quinone oxidoreductase subunit I [Candidatus Omnitrophota bacterium]MDE2232223.1 NADH-quinone oxidoreductase subunit I [Candidatus Omnitrophota bacterium]